ncbi:hypothetical protein TNCT_687701 [Trichonephila clavata]|uniref:Uncharacterized protein n=1 Tax=Trichonephila clavata TaxID=2740835 RepID=A0A8X6LZ44_TRICU|nr:hypothetical protein TNCT_687701 [Trichonephila clavata]
MTLLCETRRTVHSCPDRQVSVVVPVPWKDSEERSGPPTLRREARGTVHTLSFYRITAAGWWTVRSTDKRSFPWRERIRKSVLDARTMRREARGAVQTWSFRRLSVVVQWTVHSIVTRSFPCR